MNWREGRTEEELKISAMKGRATRLRNIAEQKIKDEKIHADAVMEAKGLLSELQSLRAQHKEALDHYAVSFDLCPQLPVGTLMYESEIVSASGEVQFICGVYFLVHDGRVVYVGQSVNVIARIAQHIADGKKFSRMAYVPCNRENLDVLESLYIHLLRPPLNGVQINGKYKDQKCAPLPLQSLLRVAASREGCLL